MKATTMETREIVIAAKGSEFELTNEVIETLHILGVYPDWVDAEWAKCCYDDIDRDNANLVQLAKTLGDEILEGDNKICIVEIPASITKWEVMGHVPFHKQEHVVAWWCDGCESEEE